MGPGDARRAWAADRLGLPPDATPTAARAAVLGRLPGVGFVPPPPWHTALSVFECRPPRADPEFLDVVLDASRSEVEAFEAEFWSMTVGRRKERWRELVRRHANDPLLALRLQRLKPGLRVKSVGGAATSSHPHDLAAWVRDLFVLPAALRAERRRALVNAFWSNQEVWELAAVRLKKDDPAVVALDPELIDMIRSLRTREQELKDRRWLLHPTGDRDVVDEANPGVWSIPTAGINDIGDVYTATFGQGDVYNPVKQAGARRRPTPASETRRTLSELAGLFAILYVIGLAIAIAASRIMTTGGAFPPSPKGTERYYQPLRR